MEELKLRVLGIDFGKRFVGVAISDPLFLTAQGVCTIERKRPDKLRKTLSDINLICEEKEVERIVVGFPKNMDGSENERCEFTKEFAKLLFNRTGIPIYFWDERLTTVSSDKELDFLGIKEKKDFSDEMAAIMILQGYMDSIKNGVEKEPFVS